MLKLSPVRAVVSDLDGTLLRGDESISSATATAIEKLRELRIPFVVATARTPSGLSVLAPIASLITAAVCCNGSIGYDLALNRRLWRSRLDTRTAAQIITIIGRHLPEAGVGIYDGERWVLDEAYLRGRGRRPRGTVSTSTRQEIAATPACTLAVRHPVLGSAQLAAVLQREGIGRDVATVSFAGQDVLDITGPGTDKASGVRRTLELLGVDPRATIAFGDAPNDLPMFALAGHSVGVANAHPEVLTAADQITSSNDDDGVARVIGSICN